MHERSDQPADEPADLDALEADDRAEAGDRRHTPEIAVVEGFYPPSLLDPGARSSRAARIPDRIATSATPGSSRGTTCRRPRTPPGRPGRVQSGSTSMWPARSVPAPARLREHRSERRGRPPRRPTPSRGSARAPRRPVAARRSSRRVDIGHPALASQLDPGAFELGRPLRRELLTEAGQRPLATVEEQHPGARRIDVAGSCAAAIAVRARRSGPPSRPRRARADHRERQPLPPEPRGRPPSRPSRTRRRSSPSAPARRPRSSSPARSPRNSSWPK